MAAYCIVTGIDYIIEECPMSAGNKHLGYKGALNDIEAMSPGAKANFYLGFLRKASDRFVDEAATAREGLGDCQRCGAPSPSEVCAFCRLVEKATRQTVELTDKPQTLGVVDDGGVPA